VPVNLDYEEGIEWVGRRLPTSTSYSYGILSNDFPEMHSEVRLHPREINRMKRFYFAILRFQEEKC